MKKFPVVFTLIAAMLGLCNIIPAWGWNDEKTHKALSDYAADYSILFPDGNNALLSMGIENINSIILWPGQECDGKTHKTECSAREWLKYGAEKEDEEKDLEWQGRFQNHFHDPLSGEGLSDLQFGTQMSALEWAQNSDAQSEADVPEGDQSWATLRGLYIGALTATDATDRQAGFAQLFKGLGHQIHLVQDMAVPTHVRNDAHPLDAMQGSDKWYRILARKNPLYFENWASQNEVSINKMVTDAFASGGAVSPDLPFDKAYADAHGGAAVCPVSQLWDADEYQGNNPSTANTQGLAEYTNANFFSDDTISPIKGRGSISCFTILRSTIPKAC